MDPERVIVKKNARRMQKMEKLVFALMV